MIEEENAQVKQAATNLPSATREDGPLIDEAQAIPEGVVSVERALSQGRVTISPALSSCTLSLLFSFL